MPHFGTSFITNLLVVDSWAALSEAETDRKRARLEDLAVDLPPAAVLSFPSSGTLPSVSEGGKSMFR